jgi:cell division protein FtsL
MNSAARVLTRQVAFDQFSIRAMSVSPYQWMINGLLVAILLTALAIVFVTNQTRGYQHHIQGLSNQSNALKVERSQLLLEQSTYAMGARIEAVAKHKLHMEVPRVRRVVVLH